MKISKKDVKLLLKWLCILLLGKAVGSVVLYIGGNHETYNQNLIQEQFINVPSVIAFLIIVISSPILEEITFRSFLMNNVFPKNDIANIATSTLVFTIVHRPTNLGSFIVYASMGLILSILYKKTNRIELCIGLHGLNNLLGVIPFFFK